MPVPVYVPDSGDIIGPNYPIHVPVRIDHVCICAIPCETAGLFFFVALVGLRIWYSSYVIVLSTIKINLKELSY